jgi:NADPH2:quinone reductase
VEIAKAHGCEHVINSTREDVAKRVREITGGSGVPAVYDSVGKDTFLSSLDSLKPLGMMVSFGNSSGKVTPFDIGILAQKGSLYLALRRSRRMSLPRQTWRRPRRRWSR